MAFDIESSDLHQSWIKDGSAKSAPVTETTPVLTTAPAVVETPNSGTVTPPAEGVTPATPAVQAAAAAAGQTVSEFIEAQLDGKPFQLPKGVQLPWKRGTESGFAPIEELQRGGMLERDYRIKTAQIAAQRRQYDTLVQEQQAREARMAAREQWIAEEEARVKASFADPDALSRLHDHFDRLKTDPEYRQLYQDAQNKRETEAENAYFRQTQEQAAVQETATQVASEITRIVGEQYPGVDPERVRQQMAYALQAGQADLSEATIHRIARMEAETVHRSVQPLRSELDAMKLELADTRKQLAAAAKAEAHNANTQHVLDRSKAPTTAPAAGNPPAPAKAPKRERYTSDKLPDVLREWSARR